MYLVVLSMEVNSLSPKLRMWPSGPRGLSGQSSQKPRDIDILGTYLPSMEILLPCTSPRVGLSMPLIGSGRRDDRGTIEDIPAPP